VAAAFVADGHTYHDPTTPAVPHGPAGVAQVVGEWRRVVPDLVLTLDDVVGQGDRVVVRFTAHGTHRGTWLGAEGTERAVAMTGIAVLRIGGGQIAETWVSWDAFGLALQVGLVLLPVSALGGEAGWEGAPGPHQRGRPH
jgi:predicted ester cyclase